MYTPSSDIRTFQGGKIGVTFLEVGKVGKLFASVVQPRIVGHLMVGRGCEMWSSPLAELG